MYGWPRIGDKDKTVIQRIHAHTARIASAVVPGRYLVDIFPVMKHFPTWIAKWKRDAKEWFKKDTKMFEEFMEDVDKRTVSVLASSNDPTQLLYLL